MQRQFPLLIAGLLAFSSCGNRSILDDSIRKYVRDGEIDATEWSDLTGKAADNADLQSNGNLDPEKLKSYIISFVSNNLRGVENPKFSSDIKMMGTSIVANSNIVQNTDTIQFKFFLERSGSMIPYDNPKTTGTFKSAIAGLLNSIPGNGSQRNLMYIVNDAVYNYNHSFKDFLQSGNIFQETKGIGDPRYTDFTCIFDSILSRTETGQLSILVSDLIYSTKNMQNVNPLRIMNEAQAMTTSTFKGHQDKDVVILKFSSDYIGSYYSYNNPHVGKEYNGMRPFYMMLVADHPTIRSIFQQDLYKDFRNFSHLKGFENYYCFSRSDGEPYYSFLLSDMHNVGRYTAARTSANTTRCIHDIDRLEPDRDGNTSLTMAIDLSNIITDQQYLLNPANYEVVSQANYRVSLIEPITEANRTQDIKNFAPQATHILVLSTSEKVINENVAIRLKNHLPNWISESNSDDDADIRSSSFGSTTFAFKYLMLGIYESFFSMTEEPDFFKLQFVISKK